MIGYGVSQETIECNVLGAMTIMFMTGLFLGYYIWGMDSVPESGTPRDPIERIAREVEASQRFQFPGGVSEVSPVSHEVSSESSESSESSSSSESKSEKLD